MAQDGFENVIIGFGKGGKTLAKVLAVRGETAALIEESAQMYGGTCINVGCIPSKSLIVNAEKGRAFSDAVAEKAALVEKLRNKNYHMIADEKNAEVITGKGRFVSNTEIEVSVPGQPVRKISGKRIFINTGAAPVFPPVPGLRESKNAITSKEAMELSALPKRLLIIGAGYIGLEFASMFRRYGSEVTVMDVFAAFLTREDEDVSARIRQDMENTGIQFRLGVSIKGIVDSGGQTEVSFTDGSGEQTIAADKVLVAAGRKPNTEGLGLENTSVELTERGAVKVDDHLKTSAPNIWAMGDVYGGLQFTYTSLDDFRIIENHLFGDGSRKLSDRLVVPYSVFITPSLSNVGLTEKEAQKRGREYRLLKLETGGVPKAHVLSDPRGLFKALVDPASKEILGAVIYAEESYELINLIALAMKAKLPYTALRDHIYTHPTMSEALNDLFKG